MKRNKAIIFIFLIIFICSKSFAQDIYLNNNWEFYFDKENKWLPAKIPGNIHSDLLNNKKIPDPFFGKNEEKLKCIDEKEWLYRNHFELNPIPNSEIYFYCESLDTYCEIFINGIPAGESKNMFAETKIPIKKFVHSGRNEIVIKFLSAKKTTESLAKNELPLTRPDHPRLYARKAQYQFGWDWGPSFISAGILAVPIIEFEKGNDFSTNFSLPPKWEFHQPKDSIGAAFYFSKNGKPIYAQGVNWIPANAFPSDVSENDYRQLLLFAKDANMNMIRVWGGGIYEKEIFYKLCDSMDIMVWQDFMFAGAMYPGDQDFFDNVKKEVLFQAKRLKKFNNIVLWCGNNEVSEAWNRWGWQNQYNIHGNDSVKIWNDYVRLFEDSIPKWLHSVIPNAAYIPTSPKFGWGDSASYKFGDSHYWGVWWGMLPWETFYHKTGRFVSEFGMQSLPHWKTTQSFLSKSQMFYGSEELNFHQKANEGFKKLNYYVDRYFLDSSLAKKLPLEKYNYVTNCVQYYILKNSLIVQKFYQPQNMGSLIWQLNDCWPVVSWSLVDYYKRPKGGFYAAKKVFTSNAIMQTDSIYPKNLVLQQPKFKIKKINSHQISIESNVDTYFVYIDDSKKEQIFSENYFDLNAKEKKIINLKNEIKSVKNLKVLSLKKIVKN